LVEVRTPFRVAQDDMGSARGFELRRGYLTSVSARLLEVDILAAHGDPGRSGSQLGDAMEVDKRRTDHYSLLSDYLIVSHIHNFRKKTDPLLIVKVHFPISGNNFLSYHMLYSFI